MLGKKKTFSVALAERGGATYSVEGIPDCAETRLLGGIASSLAAERAHLIKRVAELEATYRDQLDRLMEAQQRAAAAEKRTRDAEQEAADIRATYAAMARKPQTIRNGAGWDDVVTSSWAWPRLGLNSGPAAKPVHAPVDVYVITDKDIVLELADMKDTYTAVRDGERFSGGNLVLAKIWHRLYELGVPKCVEGGDKATGVTLSNGIVYVGPTSWDPAVPVRYHYLAVPAKKGGCKCKK